MPWSEWLELAGPGRLRPLASRFLPLVCQECDGSGRTPATATYEPPRLFEVLSGR
jgi:hypothetical protein